MIAFSGNTENHAMHLCVRIQRQLRRVDDTTYPERLGKFNPDYGDSTRIDSKGRRKAVFNRARLRTLNKVRTTMTRRQTGQSEEFTMLSCFLEKDSILSIDPEYWRVSELIFGESSIHSGHDLRNRNPAL